MKDLLRLFVERGVEFLLVGAHAVSCYTEPRATKDLDLLVNPSSENAQRVFDALKVFGAPLAGVSADDFSDPESFFIVGVKPNRIDILKRIPGLDFSAAWEKRNKTTVDGVEIPIPALEDLIAAKIAAGRPQDIADAAKLKKVLK